MSQIYQLGNDLPKAEKILTESIQLFPKVNDSKLKSIILHTLANVYGMQVKYTQALELDKQGLDLCTKENLVFLSRSFTITCPTLYVQWQI
ncbi:MAG: tetratricopeptide repeat protein [Chitinophagaceae bacterium]|nr:tetratricopeptide repeat protein [Chitinophagaceae bacterium]